MSLHIKYDHQCSKCEAYYIPYEKGIVCPNCGLNEKEVYDLVPRLAYSAKYQMDTMGYYTPVAWWIGSFGDYVALVIFKILDVYYEQKEKNFREITQDYCDNRTWGSQLYMKDHIRNLSYKVFLELKNKMDLDTKER